MHISDTALLIFSVQTKLVKPKAMEPFTPVALRGPVPIPPHRTNKAANSVSSGINPPKTSSALPSNAINSVSASQAKLGNKRLKKLFKNLCICSQEFVYL